METEKIFNMDEVAKRLTERGITSYVEMTGGGCATIMCGVANEEGYFPVCAGPGIFQHRDYDYSVGYFEDFCVGSDQDADDLKDLGAIDDINQIVDEIETFYRTKVGA